MSYLFFDTETTGLPANYNAPVSDTLNWPRLVQLGLQVFDSYGKLTKEGCAIIRPEGFVIPKQATDLHGITTERALKEGFILKDILTAFKKTVDDCPQIIGHNVRFDIRILECEYYRLGIESPFSSSKSIQCTMQMGTPVCKIPGKRGYKWPKLGELHEKLFGCGFENAHDALADIRATSKCFFEIRKRQMQQEKDPEDFFGLVKKMRSKQIGFFNSPAGTPEKNNYLTESFRLEKLVDQKILEIENPQQKLF